MIKDYSCLRLEEGSWTRTSCQVAEETPLSIFANGRHLATAMISPEMREEFLIGHLFSEGIISGIEEVESLELEGSMARVIVSNPARALLPRRLIVSGCGGSPSFLDQGRLPVVSSDLRIRKEEVLHIQDRGHDQTLSQISSQIG